MKKHIMGFDIDAVTMEEAVSHALALPKDKPRMILTPNPEIMMAAQKDARLAQILREADMLLPDGIGVVIASRLQRYPLPERVPGFDFVCRLLQTDKTFYLLGSKPGVAQKAAENLAAQGAHIVGYYHGYFQQDEDVLQDIENAKPDILLVCMGAPRQEHWIADNRDRLPPCLCIGAGGSLDVLAGEVKRAPVIYQKLCIEWLYRAIKQPERFPRLLALPKFLCKALFYKGKKGGL